MEYPDPEFVTFTYLVSRNPPNYSPTGTTTPAQTVVQSSWVDLVQGYVGLYQINVAVPPMPNPNVCREVQEARAMIPGPLWGGAGGGTALAISL